MSANRYIPQARLLTSAVQHVLQQRGIEAPIRATKIAETEQGDAWAFVVLDTAKIARMEAYTSPDVLHQIGTLLKGKTPVLCNHTGLGYGFALTTPRSLPRSIPFPGVETSLLRIGVGLRGDVAIPWAEAGHLLVAGMTGSGKSVFLRSVVYQHLASGGSVAVADMDGATLPMLTGHPALARPIARAPQDAAALVQWALGECDLRAALYNQAEGYPETLAEYNAKIIRQGQSPLPAILVVLDEFSATVTALGGATGEFAGQVAQLAWRGRKFGVRLLIAAQDFSKQIIGRVRDQIGTVICFRARSDETARLLGLSAATRIPPDRPGLAATDRWGLVQTYLLPKSALIAAPADGLDPRERALLERAQTETGGRLSIPILVGWGQRERAARQLLEAWELRGWVLRDPQRDNARYIAPKLTQILSNRPTGQTVSNLAENVKPLSNPN